MRSHLLYQVPAGGEVHKQKNKKKSPWFLEALCAGCAESSMAPFSDGATTTLWAFLCLVFLLTEWTFSLVLFSASFFGDQCFCFAALRAQDRDLCLDNICKHCVTVSVLSEPKPVSEPKPKPKPKHVSAVSEPISESISEPTLFRAQARFEAQAQARLQAPACLQAQAQARARVLAQAARVNLSPSPNPSPSQCLSPSLSQSPSPNPRPSPFPSPSPSYPSPSRSIFFLLFLSIVFCIFFLSVFLRLDASGSAAHLISAGSANALLDYPVRSFFPFLITRTVIYYPAIQTSLCASGGRSTVYRRGGSKEADRFLCLSTAEAGFADVEACSPLFVSFLYFPCFSCALTLSVRVPFGITQRALTNHVFPGHPVTILVDCLSTPFSFTRKITHLPANQFLCARGGNSTVGVEKCLTRCAQLRLPLAVSCGCG